MVQYEYFSMKDTYWAPSSKIYCGRKLSKPLFIYMLKGFQDLEKKVGLGPSGTENMQVTY